MSEYEKRKDVASGSLASSMQWAWMALGVAMTLAGAIVKYQDVSQNPGLFEFVFFHGAGYILLVSGLVVLIVSIGHNLLFGPGDEGD